MFSKHILIVENNADEAYFIMRAFKAIPSCGAYLCRSVSEAQSYLVSKQFPHPDAVLTEFRLGADSGTELLDWIRNQESTRDLTLYVWTTAISEADKQSLRHFRIKAAIVKPAGLGEMTVSLKAIAEEVCGL